MSVGKDPRLDGWSVGDRFWTPYHGACTIHDLRLRATGKHWDGTGPGPVLFSWCRGWGDMRDVEARRLRLNDWIQGKCRGGGGTPLRELRSASVERWLAADAE